MYIYIYSITVCLGVYDVGGECAHDSGGGWNATVRQQRRLMLGRWFVACDSQSGKAQVDFRASASFF